MNAHRTTCDTSILSHHSEHQIRYDHSIENEFVVDRRQISLDTSIHFPTESSSIGYHFKQNGIQKDINNSFTLNKKKGSSYTYSLNKPKVSDVNNEVDDDLLDFSIRMISSATEAIQKALNVTVQDDRQTIKHNPAVRFNLDPNTNDVLVNDINGELNNKNSVNGSCWMWNESFNGLDASLNNGSSMYLDLSFANFANDSTCGIDLAEVLEEKIEKMPINLLSNVNHHYTSKNNQLEATGTTEDDHDQMINKKTRRSYRTRRQKLQQFYIRKEYRSAFRTSKLAAEEFICHNEELVHEFYQFYISSLLSTSSSDDNVTKKDTQKEDFLKRWCKSDGRGLEHAILLSYVMSNNCPENDMDIILVKKVNDTRRYEQIPSLSTSMAHQFALMDAIIV